MEGLLGLLWDPLGRKLRSLDALLTALGRSWDALGTLLGRSRDALGALLDALGRSWPLLAAFGTLLGRSWLDLRSSKGRFWALRGIPQATSKRILNNPSARTRTFQKSTESCPRTVREDSENQIQLRCTACSLHDLSPRSLGPAVSVQRTK